jgi:hypothetical protein
VEVAAHYLKFIAAHAGAAISHQPDLIRFVSGIQVAGRFSDGLEFGLAIRNGKTALGGVSIRVDVIARSSSEPGPSSADSITNTRLKK